MVIGRAAAAGEARESSAAADSMARKSWGFIRSSEGG
jgi:hypothetical protein